MDYTFLLAIATFVLALVATVSAIFTARMAMEIRNSNTLIKDLVDKIKYISQSL